MKAKKVYWCDELGEDVLFGNYEVIKPGKVIKLIMTNNALTKYAGKTWYYSKIVKFNHMHSKTIVVKTKLERWLLSKFGTFGTILKFFNNDKNRKKAVRN